MTQAVLAGEPTTGEAVRLSLVIPPPTGDPSAPPSGQGTGPVVGGDTPPHNLPAQPTALVDRERELTTAGRLFGVERARLVTLLGPGGVGKTRLAVAVAQALLDRFPDGAWMLDLAPVTRPRRLLTAIAGTLGLPEVGGPGAVESFRRQLRGRRLLLVLDNCEHLLAAMPEVGELLAACGGLTVLATSREPLRLRWERRLPVPPLALPDRPGDCSPEALLAFPAVALFVERARAVRPDFALDGTNGQAVAELCARLDGLPLAIELAAAQSGALPPTALLARLKRHLPLPGAGPADGPARHRTLAAAIGWSYDLIDEPTRALFRRVGVCAGGWSPSAAEAVAGTDELGVDALDGLLALADKGLLRPAGQETGQPRFGMLETIRQFALERLAETGELEEVRRRHARYYLSLTAPASGYPAVLEGDGRRQRAWFDRLEQEHDNLRAALRWAAEQGDAQTELRLTAALSRSAGPTERAAERDRANPLSERERTVLGLVAQGLASKQIGRKLALAERTVKAHVTGAMNKLGANTRSQAVAVAVERRLL